MDPSCSNQISFHIDVIIALLYAHNRTILSSAFPPTCDVISKEGSTNLSPGISSSQILCFFSGGYISHRKDLYLSQSLVTLVLVESNGPCAKRAGFSVLLVALAEDLTGLGCYSGGAGEALLL